MRCVVASTGACVSTRMSHSYKWDEPWGRGGRRGVNLPPGTKRPTRPRSPRCAPTAAPLLGGAPACPLHSPPCAIPFLLSNPRRDREVPARFLLNPKQKHRSRRRCRYRAPAPTPSLPGRRPAAAAYLRTAAGSRSWRPRRLAPGARAAAGSRARRRRC